MVDKNSIILKTSEYYKENGIILPKISELANPSSINKDTQKNLKLINKDSADPKNLFRIHWHNNMNHSCFLETPEHIVLTPEFTGVDAKIIVNIGRLFPLIAAHKVLAAYACLVPRLVRGEFDFTKHKAVWPSTGNYCRGGVAISKILGCRSVAILPEGMSKERFNWLEKWVTDQQDIIKTPGTESNVKEIYDACNILAKDPTNIIINQFSEYDNYSIHRAVTGPAFEKSFNEVKGSSNLKARFYVAASGSSGTLAAGDYLKQSLGAGIAVVEATECPTLLYNGYGEHNIQGIGDKHVPLIQNVMNTDFVVGISDKATNNLNLLFNTEIGQGYLIKKKGLSEKLVNRLPEFGLSSIANILASIKLAKYMKLGSDDAIITVATDGADLYLTELDKTKKEFIGSYGDITCAEFFGQYIKAISTEDMIELNQRDKERIFNLGYYTWVEQQGIELNDFEIRRDQNFWNNHLKNFLKIDSTIDQFNNAA